jgi:hypothetical protein
MFSMFLAGKLDGRSPSLGEYASVTLIRESEGSGRGDEWLVTLEETEPGRWTVKVSFWAAHVNGTISQKDDRYPSREDAAWAAVVYLREKTPWGYLIKQ